MNIRLAYACINTELRDQYHVNRTARLATLQAAGIEYAQELALANLRDMEAIIRWNEEHGIRFYRMSSDMFPHITNQKLLSQYIYNLDFARPVLHSLGQLARQLGHRLTFHPGPYVQLGSPRQEVVVGTRLELQMHAEIFRAMGLTPAMGSVMVVHGGGTYGDPAAALGRWEATYMGLPDWREYIVLENDERSYTVDMLLPLCERLMVPLVLDFYHYSLNPGELDIYDPKVFARVMATWQRRGIPPKIHYSQPHTNGRFGAHSETIDPKKIDPRIFQLCSAYGADIVLETKDKEKSVIKVLNQYFRKSQHGDRVEWRLRLLG